jgi:hypothetical protein
MSGLCPFQILSIVYVTIGFDQVMKPPSLTTRSKPLSRRIQFSSPRLLPSAMGGHNSLPPWSRQPSPVRTLTLDILASRTVRRTLPLTCDLHTE